MESIHSTYLGLAYAAVTATATRVATAQYLVIPIIAENKKGERDLVIDQA